MSEQHQHRKYPKQYFVNTFPPNHNPIIGMLQEDTMCNVRNTLCTLQELTETEEFGSGEHVIDGYHMLLNCLISAMNFELYNRK